MPPAASLDFNALSDSIRKGIIDGTTGVVAGMAEEARKRHDLREVVDETTHKVYELDSEVKLLKGMMTSLIGTGDGSTGMVPRMERDISGVGRDMASIKQEMSEVRSDMSSMKDDVKAIRSAQVAQENQSAGVQGGITVGRWMMGAAWAAGTALVGALVWLFAHGISAK